MQVIRCATCTTKYSWLKNNLINSKTSIKYHRKLIRFRGLCNWGCLSACQTAVEMRWYLFTLIAKVICFFNVSLYSGFCGISFFNFSNQEVSKMKEWNPWYSSKSLAQQSICNLSDELQFGSTSTPQNLSSQPCFANKPLRFADWIFAKVADFKCRSLSNSQISRSTVLKKTKKFARTVCSKL